MLKSWFSGLLMFLLTWIVTSSWTSPAWAYNHTGAKWSIKNVEYRFYNGGGFDASWYDAIKKAAETWSNAGADFRFTYNQQESANSHRRDDEYFEPGDEDTVLARTDFYYTRRIQVL